VKQLTGRPGQRVDWQIASQDDGDGVENGAINVFGRRENDFIQVVLLPPWDRGD
jgi:hypothetical protein